MYKSLQRQTRQECGTPHRSADLTKLKPDYEVKKGVNCEWAYIDKYETTKPPQFHFVSGARSRPARLEVDTCASWRITEELCKAIGVGRPGPEDQIPQEHCRLGKPVHGSQKQKVQTYLKKNLLSIKTCISIFKIV